MPFDYIGIGKLILQLVGWLSRSFGNFRLRKRKELEDLILDYMIENREPKSPQNIWLHVSLEPIIRDVPFSVAFPPEYHGWQKFKFWLTNLSYEARHQWRKYWNFVSEREIRKTMHDLRRQGQLELTPLPDEFYRLTSSGGAALHSAIAVKEPPQMIRGWFAIFAFFFGLVLGAIGTFFFLPQRHFSVPANWTELATDGSGFGWASEALFNVDIPLPKVGKPHGQAKFLDRGEGGKQNILLGYIVKVSAEHLDVSKIPAKYRLPRKMGDLEVDPPKEVVYLAHAEFTLKDGDGFVLVNTKSEPLHLFSGQENVFQGIALEPIPLAVARRTKSIRVDLTADKCETCY